MYGKSGMLCALSALVVLGPVLMADADTIFNNFGPDDAFSVGGRLLQGETFGTIGNVDQAISFTVGPSSYLLTQIVLGVGVAGPPNTGTGPLDVVIASDAAGLPGGALQTSALNVNVTGQQVLHAPFPGTLQLDANTTYWVIADAKGNFDGGWGFNSTGDIGPTAGRSDNGPWNYRPADERMATRVEGRVVPEPASLAFLGIGGLGLIGFRNRRRVS
ncbi:MAG TPA: choice-of-anchor R domain-containing protein [Phycisphaerae bacterium]|nr:choice-of-anchor R domain-containing protein [Phycisphaerae bacterium]HRY68915.1 choice-of-anchor R domain-containing protein [Phycisphaerae bacterium]HSA25742.1 choice-of-anchor R domain-containing protein [Phycisphaerae bacterium]